MSQVIIYGSWAARYAGESGPAPHEVDVLLIGAPDRDDSYEAARRTEERLGREVNVTIRNEQQWQSAGDGFTRQLRSSPLLEIARQGRAIAMGAENDPVGEGRRSGHRPDRGP